MSPEMRDFVCTIFAQKSEKCLKSVHLVCLSSWHSGLTRSTLALYAREVPGSTPRPDNLDSSFHPFEVGEISSN